MRAHYYVFLSDESLLTEFYKNHISNVLTYLPCVQYSQSAWFSSDRTRHCVAAGCDCVSVKECQHPEAKFCKESSCMWVSRCHQVSTWVNAPSSGDELQCLDGKFSVVFQLFTENLSASVEQWPLILVNTFHLSDTEPEGVISAFPTIYKPAVVEVPCTTVDPC